MADLSDKDAAQTVKITGADSTGVEQTPVGSTTSGRLKTESVFADGPGVDALGKLRVTNSVVLYAAKFSDSAHTFDWPSLVASGGTITYDQPLARKTLTVNTNSGSSAQLRTRAYIPYLPGRSFVTSFVAYFSSPKTNVIQEAGMFDAGDGLFFSVNGTTQNVNIRTSTSGSPVTNSVARTNWNIDKLDGTGISGLNLDLTKPQIYALDYTWYGFGRIRFGIYSGGKLNYCHEVSNLNITAPFHQRGSLPISFRIANTGVTASSTSMSHSSCSVAGEGDTNITDSRTSVSNQQNEKSVESSSFAFPIAVRLQAAFSKALLTPVRLSLFTSSNSILYYEVILNSTAAGGTWVSQTESIAEYNVGLTSATGGKIISSGYLSSTINIELSNLAKNLKISYDTLNNIPDVLIIRVRTLSGNGKITAAIDLEETF
jgi:hypothetical protein